MDHPWAEILGPLLIVHQWWIIRHWTAHVGPVKIFTYPLWSDDETKILQQQYHRLLQTKVRYNTFNVNFIKSPSQKLQIKADIFIKHYVQNDGSLHLFQLANQMVYFERLLSYLGANQFEYFYLRNNFCIGKESRKSNVFIVKDTIKCSSLLLVQGMRFWLLDRHQAAWLRYQNSV